MKRFLFLFSFLLTSLLSSAQEGQIEHTIYVGGGYFWESRGSGAQTVTGASLKIGYALDYFITHNLSVMPGIALRSEMEGGFGDSDDGAADYDFTFLDIPVMLRYHFGEGSRWAVGVGPAFSYAIHRDEIYNDADPSDPIAGQPVIKKTDFALHLNICYKLNHWRLGIDSRIGLTDVAMKYVGTPSRHINNVSAVIGYSF